MFSWSHLYAHVDSFGPAADRQVVEMAVRSPRRVSPYRGALGRALIALGTAIAGHEDPKCLHSAEVAR